MRENDTETETQQGCTQRQKHKQKENPKELRWKFFSTLFSFGTSSSFRVPLLSPPCVDLLAHMWRICAVERQASFCQEKGQWRVL